ncbi:hypothetical protein K2173_008417 [Erythroxylum novogranatense]|uniref:RING-type domain-containing protein n=1 Tax=Erythroxylum novogranatense TaxID=1862640 RepID=A0AAV8U8Y7_9ROSI|nr:hypothetical protein K2173_008417 [Erythroxylum novogranatense]
MQLPTVIPNIPQEEMKTGRMSSPEETPPISSSTPPSINRESSDASSSSSSRVRGGGGEEQNGRSRDRSRNGEQEYEHQFVQPELEQQQIGIPFRGSFLLIDDGIVRDDTWSCVIIVLTFWFFVSLTLILGVYGPSSLSLGPDSSVFIEPNPWFVQSIKVSQSDDVNPGLKLYGFYDSPSLDVVKNWSKNYSVSAQPDSHKEWIYYLNEGSEISISYKIASPSSSIFLVVAQGNEGLAQWLEDPTYPNTTLSWNVIQGSGVIQQKVWQSSVYYVAVGNMNSEEVEVEMNIKLRALVYNTSEAYYKCTFANGQCSLNVLFPSGNVAVLTSPSSEQGSASDDWNVKLSYGPRWATYIVGIVGMSLLMLAAFNFLNKFRGMHEETAAAQFREVAQARAPLLSQKDDDLSSWGSSYDSASNDEADLEEFLSTNSLEGKPARDGENGNNTRRLCAICFDAPRDCFFLPCGHCVACFDCGTRIAEADGTCPICRKNMKKVRKIFTV